ncbi:MAG: hypothetical protein LBP42_07545, partial [Treponema sp.]|nr:hypothetical protein [Treponema sp.]
RYQTTIQTIYLEFGEQIYFFPLGSVDTENDAYIEIQLELNPYADEPPPAEAPEDTPVPAAE